MTCAKFLEELNDYLDDEVDGAMRAELERHLQKCPGCRVIWDTTLKTVRVFKGLEPYPIPPQLESRLLEAIARKAKAIAT
jgi:predicted anti-sigma-YlaC factor YlaD